MLHKLLSSSDHGHLNKPEIMYARMFPGPTEKGLIVLKGESHVSQFKMTASIAQKFSCIVLYNVHQIIMQRKSGNHIEKY